MILSNRILFISDLHLEESRPDIARTLLQFLDVNSGHCDALYILGDLFETWIGDDEESILIDEIASALNRFHIAGPSIYLMHGNRDFLMGNIFANRCGAELIEGPRTLYTEAGPIVLLHGDTLCTDDHEYMQFRKQVRQEDWQRKFLAKPLGERRVFAERAREMSRQSTAVKDDYIMDVNPQAVENLLVEFQHNILLHGHTHRPDIHELTLAKPINKLNQGKRVVLGDWGKKAWYAEIKDKLITLHSFDLTN